MAELAQAEVFASSSPKPLQVWRTVLSWLVFFFQIFLQILKGTPSVGQVLSYVGFRHPLLGSSSSSFKPLPVVELPLQNSSPADSQVCCDEDPVVDGRIKRLTVPGNLPRNSALAFDGLDDPTSLAILSHIPG